MKITPAIYNDIDAIRALPTADLRLAALDAWAQARTRKARNADRLTQIRRNARNAAARS